MVARRGTWNTEKCRIAFRAAGRFDRNELNESELGSGLRPGLAGYEVVWRNMDDSDWTHVISVGNVTSVSFPFFPKDNFIMGVRAVDINGHHSPVAYPTVVP